MEQKQHLARRYRFSVCGAGREKKNRGFEKKRLTKAARWSKKHISCGGTGKPVCSAGREKKNREFEKKRLTKARRWSKSNISHGGSGWNGLAAIFAGVNPARP